MLGLVGALECTGPRQSTPLLRLHRCHLRSKFLHHRPKCPLRGHMQVGFLSGLFFCCVVFFCLVLSCLVLSCLVSCCVVLCCVVLSCFVLFCVVLCCVVLSTVQICIRLWVSRGDRPTCTNQSCASSQNNSASPTLLRPFILVRFLQATRTLKSQRCHPTNSI